jgi:uncharacterized protein YqhQ
MAKQYYGGQAVIEGVMMRGRQSMAVAVRDPQGKVHLHQEPLKAKIYTSRWGQWPFVRGLAMLWDALGLGIRALLWSGEVAAQEEGQEKVEFKGPVAWTTIAVSLSFAIALFLLLPTWVAHTVTGWVQGSPLLDAILEGVLRLALFLAYLWFMGTLPDIRRVFGYHGAEHKTINAYEAGASLTVPEVQKFSVQHTRCGTSFLLYVLVISIILFTPLTFANVDNRWLALVLRTLSRLALIPVVAAIAYEIIRFSANHQDHRLMRIIIAPGLALQKMTTREPEDNMVEVAIAALEPVLVADGKLVPAANGTNESVTGDTAVASA